MKQLSITDLVQEHLEKQIFSGALKPGSQIKEEQISQALDISRPPIREAFKLLEASGLIKRKPRRGVFVAETTFQDVWEIYSLKAELYTFAIDLTFDKLNPSNIQQMEQLLLQMKTCIECAKPDISQYQDLNAAFHHVHIAGSGHSRMIQILEMLHKQIRYFSFHNLSSKPYLEKSYTCHCRIFNAFQKGDKKAAIEITREHVLMGLNEIHHHPEKAYQKN